ncbi:hypothetical protein [Saccharibacillus kuerlensis]|uniref:Transposase n=1 Tax=Saccharibacillus kuerlensis TaxID=459527 RepID=A0ABQ2L6N6_9BACL|nr:hypothetical protein [Saccharibacillus kuerlensis]GGO02791.1 hypothetical protein GCM10010969_26410 [Saccharibacillus kuerlensis]
MRWVASQPYYQVQREVSEGEQRRHISDRTIDLYHDRITTYSREFPLKHVFDMSYRRIGGEIGMLYLHTNLGVFSYTVNTDPGPFIDHFKSMPGT